MSYEPGKQTRPEPREHPHRQTRCDKGQRQLIPRDLDILRLIGEQYCYRFDQMQTLLARHPQTHAADPNRLSPTRTHAAIQKWKQLGLADSHKIFAAEPAYVWLTRKGLHHVGLEVAPWEPEHSNLTHYFWVNEARALLDARYQEPSTYRWESERLWHQEHERQRKLHKDDPPSAIPRSYRSKHRPDAVVRLRQNEHLVLVAIEVQLCIKSYDTWANTWEQLIQYYDAVWYYVNASVKHPILATLARWQQEESLKARKEARLHIRVEDVPHTLTPVAEA